jgi:hypothetical protein
MTTMNGHSTITEALSKRDARTDWQRCRNWIKDAVKYNGGTHTIEDIETAIEAGKMQFWPGEKCAAVTECAEYPRKKVFNITLAGGDMKELLQMIPSFASFAAYLGASEMAVAGRPGWERILRGWKKGLVVLTTPVSGALKGEQPIQ